MIFSFDLRRARKGDCFLLHFGTRSDPGLILVDAGPSDVYVPQLLPRLEAIRSARRLARSAALPLDALMVSHVDDDHINGILELTKALLELQKSRKPLPLKVRRVWHNAFDAVLGPDAERVVGSVTSALGLASLRDAHDVDGLEPSSAKVLASLGQGAELRSDAKGLKWTVNPDFDGQLAIAEAGKKAIDMTRGLSFLVVGPMKAQLDKLRRDYAAFFAKKAADATIPKRLLASFTDDSVPNLASIVVLASAGGKRMLLTGDARGDKILDGLRLMGVMPARGPLHVDILKMPHHGSDRNMTQDFLEQVTADHYVFSGDGEHGNPERATLDMLRLARGSADYTIHVTYPVAEIDVERQRDWEEQQRLDRARKKPKVRADWSAKTQSLAAFFAAHPALARKLRVVPATGGHVIDLLDPLGF
jgi:hypothetical protein